jgi:uncharacterized RDD family membrane protein YckC
MPVEYRYATFGPRFWAGFIDGLVFLPVSLLDNYLTSPERTALVLIAWAIFSYSTYWVYSVTLHAHRGQTIGKKTQHVKVLDVSETRIPSLRQALLRDIGGITAGISGTVYFTYLVITHAYRGTNELLNHWPWRVLAFANLGWFLLELITMLTNSKRRAFHDVIADTVVVRVD